jgi:hypothetical protein
MLSTTCNLNCICVDADCSYKHYIIYKDRKIVKQFYETLSNKMKDEPNPDTRKKNCTFGQLCDKETCGFRHRLSFANREKLIVSYKFNKICPSIPSEITSAKSSEKKITLKSFTQNLYLSLDNSEDENDNEEIKEEEIIEQPKFIKSWVDAVVNKKEERWEDLADEDFYMKF